jgi:glycosyltransferase involved in cell wall biosynthesis
MMRVLAFTNLFPNRAEPARGRFNLQFFQALAQQCADLRVVAPVRLVPRAFRCGDRDVPIPAREEVGGLDTWHPRYAVLPRVALWAHAAQMGACLAPAMRLIRREYPFDLLFATWAFPDIVAAASMARRWRVPLAAKVHGTDIQVLTRYPLRRRQIVRALNQACMVLAVADVIRERLLELGVPEEKILVQRNAVDPELFQVRGRDVARRELGLDDAGLHLLFVGTFRLEKGLPTLLEALPQVIAGGLPVTLHLVGDGRLEEPLREQARARGIESNVRFEGYQSHERIPLWIAAADALCLPSITEGCPNVVLETLACGRPVVASRAGGIPEILGEDTGVLVQPGSAADLADGIREVLQRRWDPGALRATVLERSWSRNAAEAYQWLAASVPAFSSGRLEECQSGCVGV